jgi:hypothetical protein
MRLAVAELQVVQQLSTLKTNVHPLEAGLSISKELDLPFLYSIFDHILSTSEESFQPSARMRARRLWEK